MKASEGLEAAGCGAHLKSGKKLRPTALRW